MRDEETSSVWLHYTGECIAGPRAGRQLELVSTTAMTWRAFRDTYPEGTTIPPARQWWRRLMGGLIGHRGMHMPLPRLFRLPAELVMLLLFYVPLAIIFGYSFLTRGAYGGAVYRRGSYERGSRQPRVLRDGRQRRSRNRIAYHPIEAAGNARPVSFRL